MKMQESRTPCPKQGTEWILHLERFTIVVWHGKLCTERNSAKMQIPPERQQNFETYKQKIEQAIWTNICEAFISEFIALWPFSSENSAAFSLIKPFDCCCSSMNNKNAKMWACVSWDALWRLQAKNLLWDKEEIVTFLWFKMETSV